MATVRWLGTAAAVAQVTGYLFAGTWETTDIVEVTIGSKTLAVTAGSTTPATVVLNVLTAFNALDTTLYPEFAEITASQSTATLVLTGDTEGVPFTATVSTRDVGGAADAQTIDGTTSSTGVDSTACSGPNFWSVAANWSGGAVPVNADDVILERSSVSIKYGLDQSAVTLTSLRIDASFTGDVGLPERNRDATEYDEYRATYLVIGATTQKVGQGSGQGSQRIKLDNSNIQTTLLAYLTGSEADQDTPTLLWKGTNASNVVRATGGSVGIAALGGEVATVLTLGVAGGASVVLGSGVTWTTIDQEGGFLQVSSNGTTITKVGGTLLHLDGTITTLTNDAGGCDMRGAGTITTVNNSGEVIFTNDNRALTVTTTNAYKGSTLLDGGQRVTFTNGIVLVRCRLTDVVVDVGLNRTITVA
jgi:hypothetical protein